MISNYPTPFQKVENEKIQEIFQYFFLIMQIRIMTLAKNVMTETGVLPVNENTNQAIANATN